jgi:hypothetical protein
MTSKEIIETETFTNPFCRFERVLPLLDGYCIFELRLRDDEIMLNNIRVNENDLGKGYGTSGLDWLKNISEITGEMITGQIEPNGHKKLNFDKLSKWYQKNGFIIDDDKIMYYPKSWYN